MAEEFKMPHIWGNENMGGSFYMFTLYFLSILTSPVHSETEESMRFVLDNCNQTLKYCTVRNVRQPARNELSTLANRRGIKQMMEHLHCIFFGGWHQLCQRHQLKCPMCKWFCISVSVFLFSPSLHFSFFVWGWGEGTQSVPASVTPPPLCSLFFCFPLTLWDVKPFFHPFSILEIIYSY